MPVRLSTNQQLKYARALLIIAFIFKDKDKHYKTLGFESIQGAYVPSYYLWTIGRSNRVSSYLPIVFSA